MKTFAWIAAGVGAGAALAYLILNQPRPQAATGWDSVEDASRRTVGWGSETRLSGVGRQLGGKLKQGLGTVTGDQDMADEGAADQAIGSVKDAAGAVAQAAGDALHDLNR